MDNQEVGGERRRVCGSRQTVAAIGHDVVRRDRAARSAPSIASVADAARSCNPAAAVVSAVDPRIFRRHAEDLRQLALTTRLCLGGAGAAKARLDADLLQLTGDPIHEAERLTELAQSEPQRLNAGRAELTRPRKTPR